MAKQLDHSCDFLQFIFINYFQYCRNNEVFVNILDGVFEQLKAQSAQP